MKFEIEFKIYGNLKIPNDLIEIKKHPYLIKIFKKDVEFYISISKTILEDSDCLPRINSAEQLKEIEFPKESSYFDMIELVNYIESFGSLDNRLELIDTSNITLRWIAENDDDHFSPFNEIKRQRTKDQNLDPLSEDWLFSTLVHRNQLGELFFPFSFYRDGKNLFHALRYQSSFCAFYMMLEYFFNEKGWGIQHDAYERKKCLKNSLIKTLEDLKKYKNHHKWLINELTRRHKKYDEAGLLFIINIYRNELSHAVDKRKSRNVFTDDRYFSLSYITMTLCVFVTIKKRLLPFVRPSEIDKFLDN